MAKFLPRFSAFFPASVCLACAAALFAAGRLSSAALWKDFRILCVSPPDREGDLLALLEEAGLREYVTEANSAFLPSQSMTPFIPFMKEAEALRSRWFFDDSGEYRIVYISERAAPWNYAGKLRSLLEKAGFSWAMERKGGLPILPGALLFLSALLIALRRKPFPSPAFFACVLLASAVMVSPVIWLYGRQGLNFFWEKEEKNRAEALYIPAPEMYTSKGGFSVEACEEAFAMGSALNARDAEGAEGGLLLSLSDFIALQWNVMAYPWRKMSEPFEFPRAGARIWRAAYRESNSGALRGERIAAARFDSEFIMMAFETCASPLEKMLIGQGSFCTVKRRRLP